MTFSNFDLDPRVRRGIAAAGYTAPTPIQSAALPPALAGRDLVATAQTGTGKTAAFVLPLLERLLPGPRGFPRALVVAPTRELAEQVHETVRTLGGDTGLRSVTIYGGVGIGAQEAALRRGAEILVACPGRLLDLVDRGSARLGGVELLVLDEADRLFDMGFLPAVRRIVRALPAARQTLLFSATFPPEVESLAQSVLSKPERVAVGTVRPATTVSHALYPVPQHLKAPFLLALLPTLGEGSVLVFARTRHRANRLARQLAQAGHSVAALHGDRSQGQRQAALEGFRRGRVRLLVATDIAARGIDVEGISHVINFDIPDTTEAYIHRIGRTGRAERLGDAFTLVTPDDLDLVRAIEKAVGQPIRRLTLAGFDYTVPAPPANPSQAGGRQAGARQAGARQPAQRNPARPAASHGGSRGGPDKAPATAPAAPSKSPATAPATALSRAAAPRPGQGGHHGRSRRGQGGWRG